MILALSPSSCNQVYQHLFYIEHTNYRAKLEALRPLSGKVVAQRM